MSRTFFIVGPTATGKSEIAADVARNVGAEIVSADAFQIYYIFINAGVIISPLIVGTLGEKWDGPGASAPPVSAS